MVATKLAAQRAAEEDRRDWWRSAACQEADPELFFPVAVLGPAAGEIARAKAVCGGCRVRRQCLQYALATHQVHGVWGGLTEGERQLQMYREREREREHSQRGRSTASGSTGTRCGRNAGSRGAGTARGTAAAASVRPDDGLDREEESFTGPSRWPRGGRGHGRRQPGPACSATADGTARQRGQLGSRRRGGTGSGRGVRCPAGSPVATAGRQSLPVTTARVTAVQGSNHKHRGGGKHAGRRRGLGGLCRRPGAFSSGPLARLPGSARARACASRAPPGDVTRATAGHLPAICR